MSTDWKPGDVAMATFCGEEAVRVVRYHGGWARLNDTDDYIPDEPVMGTHVVTDARPLVVIDPEDREQVERLAIAYAAVASARLGDEYIAWENRSAGARDRITTDLTAALREFEFANPTPPRPEEPLGLGAVVATEEDGDYIRVSVELSNPWLNVQSGSLTHWDAVRAVRILSEGVAL